MNERILELLVQSGLLINVSEYQVNELDPNIKKFAELIIQDIDKIIEALYHALPLEQASVLLTLDENIKEHFYGVKG